MMIEPPGQFRRIRIFKIHNRVLISVKHIFLKRTPRQVRHSRIKEFGVRIDSLTEKTREHGRRSRSIKTAVVKKYAYLLRIRHSRIPFWIKLPNIQKYIARPKMAAPRQDVKPCSFSSTTKE